MEVLDSGASGAVNFVLGFSGKDVGIAYKERVDKGIYAVSVRGSPSCKTHLGRLVSSVSSKLGGSGGGHDKACGAVIPKDKIVVISRAAKELANYYEVILRKLQTTRIKTAYSEEEIKKIMEIADEIDRRIGEKEDEEGEYYPEETKVTLH